MGFFFFEEEEGGKAEEKWEGGKGKITETTFLIAAEW